MVFSVKTYNNINQIGLKELGNHFQIDEIGRASCRERV